MHANIQRHITQSYYKLRIGMTIMAFVLPVALLVTALVSGQFDAQELLSAYYHTPMRNLFVGTLVSIGAFLYLYKGFSQRENIALNVAGMLAALVAFLPDKVPELVATSAPAWLPADPFVAPVPHKVVAIAFFIVIAYVCLFKSRDTLALMKDPIKKAHYIKVYRLYGVLMIVLPLVAAICSYFSIRFYTVFIAEVIALWVFAAFWLTKSREVRDQANSVEVEALEKQCDL